MSDDSTAWKVLCIVLMIPLIMAVRGWALVALWRWFVAPFGVHALTFWWGYGLSLTVGVFKTSSGTDEKKDAGELAIKALGDMLACALVVFVGYLVHHYAVIG